MRYLSFTIIACFFFLVLSAQDIKTFELRNRTGMKAVVSNYGARIMRLEVRNWNGRLEPVIKGYKHMSNYRDDTKLGATLMSFGGDVSSVLADKVWETVKTDCQTVTFRCVTDIKDGGHDGKLNVSVTYTLSDQNALDIDYSMVSTIPTYYNLTNGIVFNLSGDLTRSILKQNLWIDSYKTNILDTNHQLTNEQQNVRNTPLDFNQPRELGERIGYLQNGYNHIFQLRHHSNEQSPDAILFDEQSGRVMTVYTIEPILRINSYGKQSTGISFQPIHGEYDDSKKEIKAMLSPGEVYRSATVFTFTTDPPLIMRKEHIGK